MIFNNSDRGQRGNSLMKIAIYQPIFSKLDRHGFLSPFETTVYRGITDYLPYPSTTTKTPYACIPIPVGRGLLLVIDC